MSNNKKIKDFSNKSVPDVTDAFLLQAADGTYYYVTKLQLAGSITTGYLAYLSDTAAGWTSSNPILPDGSIGIESDTMLTSPKFKIAFSSNHWNDLPYANAFLSGLTTNKVLKATSSTTAGDSNITDDGTTVIISTNLQVDGVIQSPNGLNTVTVVDTVVSLDFNGTTNSGYVSINDTRNEVKHDDLVELNAPSVTKNGVEVATVNDIPPYPTTYDLFITTGNQTTTSNVASNITDLVSPTLTANKRYRISGVIHFGCNNVGGVKYQITVPSGATLWIMGHSNLNNANTITWTPVLSSATLSPPFAAVNNADYGALCIDGEISIGATAGVIQFGFASATNTQTSTVYKLGTQLTLTQIN